MNYPLAIFAPHMGVLSETFIRRHMQDLLPSRTLVVTKSIDGPCAGHWNVDCPKLVLNRLQSDGLKPRGMWAGLRRLGWRSGEQIGIVKRFLKKHHVKVVMGEYLDWALPWLKVAKKTDIRFFAHAHGYDVSRQLHHPKWPTKYLLYNRADGVITMSQMSRTRLIDLGLDASKVHVVPYGIDVPDGARARPESESIRLLAVGRFTAKKAPILTLDAFRRATKACPNLLLDYVGAGELLPVAHQYIRAFNLKERVKLHGGQPSKVVQSLMREADIFLQHSITNPVTGDEEGLPVAILEAMAQSLPVVSTWHAGIPEAVIDGLTGYLVEEGDSNGMAERIITLARDLDLRQNMGKASWRQAKEHFTWDKERRELLKVLGLSTYEKEIL